MAHPSKAKRPKRRWVGIHLRDEIGRAQVNSILENIFPSDSLKLYDLQIIDGKCYGIVRINLSEVSDFIVKCETDPRLQTITTSGKIRLVRERLEIPRPKVRR
tara:strand:+ start:239 stop:547 length:309 start_codon:yes stop_codon:yes gene_type:complete